VSVARLGDQQRARRGDPGRETDLPETIGAAGCHVGKVERRRSRAPYAGGRTHHHLEHREVGLGVLDVRPVGKARADQRALESALLAHPDAPPVELGAGAARGREQLAAQGVEHDGDLDAALVFAGDGHGELRKAVQEVGGPVERVDDPDVLVAA